MIEVGEYVRTKKKGIFKVLSIRKTPYGHYCGTVDNDNIRTFTIGKGGNAEIKNDIVKHSFYIIDLIEVGDYVNGYYVERIWEQVNYKMAIDLRGSYLGLNDEKFIKSIVTKEQFANIEYRLEENK